MRGDVIIIRLIFTAILIVAGYVLRPIAGDRWVSAGVGALIAICIILFELRIRRATLKTLIDSGRIEEIPEFLAQSALSDEERKALGRIHPAFMGGEYLPDLRQREVMIARITIASTTQDVTCVYARRGRKRIRYRVVDEYEGETLTGCCERTSTRPLTLGELAEFFDGAWSIFSVLSMNFGHRGYDEGQMQRFVVEVSSSFYPELGALYRSRIHAWAAAKRLDDGDAGAKEST